MSAVVTEVGASLRSFRSRGEPVIWEYGEKELCSAGRGQVLAPWPNRLEDGTYRYGSVGAQAALDEPERRNAIHGLVRWMPFEVLEHTPASARLGVTLRPQPAYPFEVRLEVAYALGAGGLEVSASARSEGEGGAPFGVGFHPYLCCGRDGVDGATLELAARCRILLDGRGLPTGSGPAEGHGARKLTGVVLDDCYEVDCAPGARWQAKVSFDEGAVELWADSQFAYAMCFTGDTLPDPADRRRAIAVEPMTCPPNALRSGEGIIELEPGREATARWGIRPL